MEKYALEKNARISLYRSILQKNPHFDSLKRSVENNQNINFSQTIRSYILNSFWQLVKTFNIMELLPIIYCWSVKQAVEKQVLYKV